MRITIRLFATLKDRAGASSTELELREPATVADVLTRLAEELPALTPSIPTVLVAVNREYSFADTAIHAGDEVALFPPVSGGAGGTEFPEHFAVTSDALDIDSIVDTITTPETGAVCIFSGTVRGVTKTGEQTRNTGHLDYEAYIPMAEDKLRQVATEIREQFPDVHGIALVQRIGTLLVGETTILVACAAAHRYDGCFEAARYGIDRVKEIVPVWKKEVSPDSEIWVEGTYRPTPADIRGSDSEPRVKNPVATQDDNGIQGFAVGCPVCGRSYALDALPLRCICGGPLEVARGPAFDPTGIEVTTRSIWRYRKFLLPENVSPVTLGEGWTPLVPSTAFERAVYLKMESANPTGSFKDRGASVLVSFLTAQGIRMVHDDSSGNAGAALAAYAARGGTSATLYVPESASPIKLGQIRLYGAELIPVAGPRSEARKAAEASTHADSVYASHIDHPFSVFAYKSIAYELWEQLGQRAPDAVILPLGHGSQLLGLKWGFDDLLESKLINKIPRLIGVQSRACAPLWYEMHRSDDGRQEGTTLAEGIRVINPVRHTQVIEAIRGSHGDIVTVEEGDILTGIREFARRGFVVEPTSAVVWEGLGRVTEDLPKHATVVVSITGSGLKYPGLEQLVKDNLNREGSNAIQSTGLKG